MMITSQGPAGRRGPMAAAAVALATLLTTPVLAHPMAPSGRSGATWTVVTFSGRIAQADRLGLERAGATAIQYHPRNSYVAWMTPAAIAQTETLGSVRTVRPLSTTEKIDPYLNATGRLRLHVLVHRGQLEPTAAAIAALGDIVEIRDEGDVAADMFISAPAGAVSSIASHPAVRYVGPAGSAPVPLDEAGAQITAGNIVGTSPVPGYESWLSSVGLDGTGVKVSIVDTGVDGRHPDLAGRVVDKVDYSSSPAGEPVDVGGHGTHVAGIVGGNATGFPPAAGRIQDPNGFLYGMGVAPKVQLIDQNAIATSTPHGTNCSGGWRPPLGWEQLTRDGLSKGASIWNASWRTCEGAGAGYIASSAAMDGLVLDGDSTRAGAQPFTMVFAAGNAGSNASTIEAPSEAKNTIVVGASNNSRAGDINAMATFSSRGPARDGRMLPTVSAPGASVISARALNPAVSCNTPVAAGAGLYATCSGTSMASPHVAGSVALITQWWRRSNAGADPSPAMSKALLVNSARDMGAADIPNRNEGWGRVDLSRLFDASTQRVYVDRSVDLTDLDATHSVSVVPADPTKPLKVTLVWSDVPGAPSADPALVNDLDLTVTDGSGVTYVGNRFSGGRSITGGGPDRRNNLENVFLTDPAGTYTVSVKAFNLPGDGILFDGDETDQDFALVISNAILQ